MPFWVWAAVFLAGILVLVFFSFLFLFRVRYQLNWEGWTASAVLEYGFLGFMRTWNFSSSKSAAASTATSTATTPTKPESQREEPFHGTDPGAGNTRTRRERKWARRLKERGRRALFHFITDPAALRVLFGYGGRLVRLTFGLLRLELHCALGHPDPAFLGRLAGYWYAVAPGMGKRVHVDFRFQDQKRTLSLSARGEFSAARALRYAAAAAFSFPWFTLVKRVWCDWRQTELTGWRAMVYARLRKAL